MGRKDGTLYINPSNFGSLQKPCAKEMVSFLNCLTLNHNKDEKCGRVAKTESPGVASIITCKGLTGEGILLCRIPYSGCEPD
ncbi:uncharacterized protein LOC107847343 [Capsicum annuum]|uniref:uncharacterized protein LOC107847343 n=1 Tax=Capsicum annuum TaxID=4072 RepID=UPI001FB102E0|nr:uncharacterized protein LOC107847343 [Capsicum annuum]